MSASKSVNIDGLIHELGLKYENESDDWRLFVYTRKVSLSIELDLVGFYLKPALAVVRAKITFNLR